jgi:MinD-like ATPase involved in chromosome partitioning or flagellar assembly
MSAPEQLPELGEIFTFYSYKGGTGRSMALANVASLLARKLAGSKGVLMVDWDLEAPGLHRFFQNRLMRRLGQSGDVESALNKHPGLIDLFYQLNDVVSNFPHGLEEPTDEMERALRQAARIEDFVLETDVPSLHLMKAGRFDGEYPKRINTFSWEALYTKAPWLFPLVADWLTTSYRYVLIDSRTGVTDTSGICTMLMPEKLVVVFTPNRQSLLGVLQLAERATNYRRRSGDLRPLMIYPLPSRIDPEEPDRRTLWRFGNPDQGISGYQPLFEKLFTQVYRIPHCSLQHYFEEVQIQHASSYSYGEEVAVLVETTEDRLSLSRSYEVFTQKLIETTAPWEEIDSPEGRADAEKAIALAEKVYASLTPPEREQARHVFTRLVRLARPEEGGEDTRRRLSLDLNPWARPVIQKLAEAGVVLIEQDDTKAETAKVASEALLRNWGRLRGWLDGDRTFLFWRQRLQVSIAEWESRKRNTNALLFGVSLTEAEQWLERRRKDLNDIEQLFIGESIQEEVKRRKRRLRRWLIRAVVASSMLILLLSVYLLGFQREPTLIMLGIWPNPYSTPWSDEFLIGTANNEPNAKLWDYPKGQWKIVRGEGLSSDDGALLVEGDSWGVLNNLGANAFYDFTAEFKVGFQQGTRAAWVIRAQPDKQRGYVFELERRGEVLYLSGWAYLGDDKRPLPRLWFGNPESGHNQLPSPSELGNQLPLYGPFYMVDAFYIEATVKDFEFQYCITLHTGMMPAAKDDRPSVGNEYCVSFTDEGRFFRYGNMGILETDANSQMRVEFWRASPIQ